MIGGPPTTPNCATAGVETVLLELPGTLDFAEAVGNGIQWMLWMWRSLRSSGAVPMSLRCDLERGSQVSPGRDVVGLSEIVQDRRCSRGGGRATVRRMRAVWRVAGIAIHLLLIVAA